MAEGAEMAHRHAAVLAELTEVGLAAMRDIQACLLAAADAKAKADLALALQRTQRSVRQTLALELRLKREAKQQAREDRQDAARQTEKRLSVRKAQVKACVEKLIWTEYEGKEAEALVEELDACLDEDALFDGFLETSIETHITRLSDELGLQSSPSPEGDQGEVDNPPPLGVACEARGAGSQQRPGERPEGVAAPGLSGLQPPHPPTAGAPPMGEHLESFRSDHPWRSSG
jgi:hypothetical protein